ncbi:MAG: AmmeMemoRadiSam system protein A [Candidatus Bipolaricaulia bacterium]
MKLWIAATVIVVAGILLLVATREVPVKQAAPVDLTPEDRTFLLDLARQTLRAHVSGYPEPTIDDAALADELKADAACFVTLNKGVALRGCILDSFVPHEAVYRNVMRNVILAGTGDPRFPPVESEELDALTIEISILGRPYPIEFDGPDELVSILRPGIDGVILTTSFGSSTYLPQVWKQLPDAEQFLTELCRKQGAPGDCWRTDNLLRVEIYQVNHFGEADVP